MFADDTNILSSHENIKELFHVVNSELSKVFKFAKKLIFHWNFNGHERLKNKTNQLTRVLIDGHLTRKEHLTVFENKTSKNLGVLDRTKKN